MVDLIKKILKEDSDNRFFKLISNRMKSNEISPPFFKKFKNMGLSDQEIESIMEYFFDGDIRIEGKNVFNGNNDLIYYESWDSTKWELILYNKFNKMTYREDHRGRKEMREYDENGKETYRKDSSGYWQKREYNKNGVLIYFEKSDGTIFDDRPKRNY